MIKTQHIHIMVINGEGRWIIIDHDARRILMVPCGKRRVDTW